MSENKQRATCWSITVNNPTDADYKMELPSGWALTGQLEKGAEGTVHYQGMLTTPQVRFTAVKKVFERAHIEVAKNKSALSKYVKKSDTRLAECEDNISNIPTLFNFQHTIALEWDDVEFAVFTEQFDDDFVGKNGMGEIALRYVDSLVAKHIEAGVNGVEYIAINPMWRSAWKKFYRPMVARERNARINSCASGIEEECPSLNEVCAPSPVLSGENALPDQ